MERSNCAHFPGMDPYDYLTAISERLIEAKLNNIQYTCVLDLVTGISHTCPGDEGSKPYNERNCDSCIQRWLNSNIK